MTAVALSRPRLGHPAKSRLAVETDRCLVTARGGIESSESYPLLMIIELYESIMYALIVLSGLVW